MYRVEHVDNCIVITIPHFVLKQSSLHGIAAKHLRFEFMFAINEAKIPLIFYNSMKHNSIPTVQEVSRLVVVANCELLKVYALL